MPSAARLNFTTNFISLACNVIKLVAPIKTLIWRALCAECDWVTNDSDAQLMSVIILQYSWASYTIAVDISNHSSHLIYASVCTYINWHTNQLSTADSAGKKCASKAPSASSYTHALIFCVFDFQLRGN
jgi:hypothetical protein